MGIHVTSGGTGPPPAAIRGDWAPNTAYLAGQMVWYGSGVARALYTAKIGFTSGSTFDAANLALVGLPPGGSTDQVAARDGSGNVVWRTETVPTHTHVAADVTDFVAAIPFAAARYQKFTASGTWTRPSGVTRVMLKVLGGGGGGGGGGSAAAAQAQVGGGGGAAAGVWTGSIDVTGDLTITIGAGGVGGVGGVAGGAAGTTSAGSNLGGNTTVADTTGTRVLVSGGGGGAAGGASSTTVVGGGQYARNSTTTTTSTPGQGGPSNAVGLPAFGGGAGGAGGSAATASTAGGAGGGAATTLGQSTATVGAGGAASGLDGGVGATPTIPGSGGGGGGGGAGTTGVGGNGGAGTAGQLEIWW